MGVVQGGKRRSGRPKRSEENAEESRARIVEAAKDLFAGSGYNGTSIRAIASRAGVSEGLIYHYFKNKSDLLYEILSNGHRIRPEVLEEWLRTHADREDGLEGFIRALFDFFQKKIKEEGLHQTFLILFNSMQVLDLKEKERMTKALHEGLWNPLVNMLESRLPPELKGRVQPYILFRILQGSFMGYVLFQEMLEWKRFLPLEPEAYGETAAMIFSRGLRSLADEARKGREDGDEGSHDSRKKSPERRKRGSKSA